MPLRVPSGSSPTETRQAFQRIEAQAGVINNGASGEILVGAGIGVIPTWQAVSAAIDHGAVGGLTDDDHAQYSLADGTRDFSGVIVGVDPTASNHLATKEYVDSAISFIEEFFLTDTASGISSYFNMVDQHTGEAESSDPTGSITQTDGQALTEWITIANTPSITDLEHGIYSVHLHAEKTGGGARDVVIYFEVYTRTHPGGTETLRATSEVSDLITSRVAIDLHAVLTADVAINETDRIVVKFFANGISGGNNATIILYSEGTTASHFGMPISSEVLSTIFLRQDGTKALTGNMAVDAGITIDGRDISADGATLDALAGGKVAIDTDATPDFLGNAFNDGALRASTGISYADGGNFVTLTTNDGEIVHDNLSGYDANDHTDHTTITLTAGSGIAGGGTIAANRLFDLDINSLAAAAIAAGDFVPFWDITATATNKKITFANFEGALDHDSLSGYVAAEHIDWTGASDDFGTSGHVRTGAFTIEEVSNDTNRLGIQSTNAATYSLVDIYSNDGDGTDNVGLAVFAKGTPTDWTPWEVMNFRWDQGNSEFTINTDGSEAGEPLNIYTKGNRGQLLLNADESVQIRRFKFVASQGFNYRLGIQCTVNSTDVSFDFYATPGSGGDDVRLTIFGVGTPTDWTPYEILELKWDTSESEYSLAVFGGSGGTVRPLNIYTSGNSGQVYLKADGTVGVNNSNPSYTLDITGTLGVSGNCTFGGTGHDTFTGATIASHDTSATGAELDTLTDDSMSDALHRHSELSASDGSPNPAVVVEASTGILTLPDSGGIRLENNKSIWIKNSAGDPVRCLLSNASNDCAWGSVNWRDLHFYTGRSFFVWSDTQLILHGTTNGYVGVATTPDARFEVSTGSAEGQQAITIDQNDADQAFIDFQGTSAANADNSISTWTAGNSIQGFVWVEINGVKKRMAYYDEPTS